jgi:hypothetical protein
MPPVAILPAGIPHYTVKWGKRQNGAAKKKYKTRAGPADAPRRSLDKSDRLSPICNLAYCSWGLLV